MKFFENKFSKKEQPVFKILPSDVRYALEYKEGKLNKDDLEVLVMSNFEDEAFYLTLKSLTNNKEEHKNLLRKYISNIINLDHGGVEYKKCIQDIVNEELDLNKNLEVDGVKLAQISRQGFDTWQDKFKTLSNELSKSDKNVFLVAHSTILGLHSFLKNFAKEEKDLNIIVPSWFKDKCVGYNISFSEGKTVMNDLHNDFNKINTIAVDDTVNTGSTIDKVKDFWLEFGEYEPEIRTVVGK